MLGNELGAEVDANLDCDLQPALGSGALLLIGEISTLAGPTHFD